MSDTPLTDAIRRYRATVTSRLHVPSHGGGAGSPGIEALFGELVSWDVTEQPELDDLSHPDGPIAAAQGIAAEFFGAPQAFFLTAGATLGIQVAVLAALQGGGALLGARDSHRSLLGAAFAQGCDIVLLDPLRDARSGASLGPDPEAVEREIERSPDIRAVLVNYPSYLGIVPDLRQIAQRAHARGALVIADAAHGAHFGLHPDLPEPALAAGADFVILGMHKSGGALTQSAMLLLGDAARHRADAVRLAMSLLGTSSPSYPLMVSLEQAVHDMRAAIPARLDKAIRAAEGVQGPARIKVAAPQDPLRIAWRSPRVFEIAESLALAGVRGEYVDGDTALCCVPFGAQTAELEPLRLELARLPAPPAPPGQPGRGPVRIFPRAALLAGRRQVHIGAAEGAIAADVVAPVPPGIPALWPGERISAEVAGYLVEAAAQGRRIMGLDHEQVWVVAE